MVANQIPHKWRGRRKPKARARRAGPPQRLGRAARLQVCLGGPDGAAPGRQLWTCPWSAPYSAELAATILVEARDKDLVYAQPV